LHNEPNAEERIKEIKERIVQLSLEREILLRTLGK